MSSAWDPQRFDRLVRETHGAVRSCIAGLGVPASEVDDVAQEVYLDLARDPARMPADVDALRWLRGMARNCSREWFRRRARQSRHHERVVDLLAEAEPAVQAPAEADGRLAALGRCLEKLGAGQRRLLERHYRDGEAVADLAREAGRTPGAMHMAIARLREALRRCLHGLPEAGA